MSIRVKEKSRFLLKTGTDVGNTEGSAYGNLLWRNIFGGAESLSLNASASMRTVPVGITLYQGEFTFPWPIISAALIVAIVPVAVLIALFQERVVGGLTQGGLKG